MNRVKEDKEARARVRSGNKPAIEFAFSKIRIASTKLELREEVLDYVTKGMAEN